MIEYYREALLEAVVFCVTRGYTEEYIVSLDVYAFGEIYKYLKRIEAREDIRFTNNVRIAMGANKKDYGKAMDIMEKWLPSQEKSNEKGNASAFNNFIKGGGLK